MRYSLFHFDFNRVQPGGIGFSVHIAVNGKVEDVFAHGKDRVQYFKGWCNLEERGLSARVNSGPPAFAIYITVPV